MKKHIKLEWVYIAVLVISLILSIVTGVQIAGEVVMCGATYQSRTWA